MWHIGVRRRCAIKERASPASHFLFNFFTLFFLQRSTARAAQLRINIWGLANGAREWCAEARRQAGCGAVHGREYRRGGS